MIRQLPFILAATNQGTFIVSRHDYRSLGPDSGFGVGFQLLNTGQCDEPEHAALLRVFEGLKEKNGPGVVVLDCGANIGVTTVTWARAMTAWGSVIAIEAQTRLFYALCGNIALNNCFNATAYLGAVASRNGAMRIPEPDYFREGSLGSFELRRRPDGTTEDIGQEIDYDKPVSHIPTIAIDDLGLTRCDFIKIDVEGMEADVLRGARKTMAKFRPMLFVERDKTPDEWIKAELTRAGYVYGDFAMGWLCQHESLGPVTLPAGVFFELQAAE